jgi:hypothetical protein
MKIAVGATAALLLWSALPAAAQETPPSLVAAYESLADTILDLRQAEGDFVRALLDGHLHAARALKAQGQWQGMAAQMALFANEGDNAIGGVRKRLLAGGHHFNAEGEDQGIFEPGYVVVTKEAKRKLLAASTALRQATDDAARMAAWSDFEETAKKVLSTE